MGAAKIGTLLRELRDEQQRTVVVITHEATLASYADRVVLLADGQICGELSGRRDAAELSQRYVEMVAEHAGAEEAAP